MWVIAVLLLISFSLFLFTRIAKTLSLHWVFVCLGMAVWSLVMFLTSKNESAFAATFGFLYLSGAVSDLIAIPILRRRVIPPCVRVEKPDQGGWEVIVACFGLFAPLVFIVVVTESLHSTWIILFMGFMSGSFIIYYIVYQVGKVEICGNGVWHSGRLHPWEEYESFSWKWRTKDSVELKLASKSWLCPSTRLMAPSEDREAVQQLLEASLPDLGPTRMTS